MSTQSKVRLKNKLDRLVKVGQKLITTDVINVYSVSDGSIIGSIRYSYRGYQSIIKVRKVPSQVWYVADGRAS